MNRHKSHPFGPPRPTKHPFTLFEVTVALITAAGIHEGYWQLQAVFGQSAANISINGQMLPTVITQFAGLQLTRVKDLDPLTVDAEKVNPEKRIVVPGMSIN